MNENALNFIDLNSYVKSFVTEELFKVAYIGLKNAIKRINLENKHIKLNHFSVEDCIEFVGRHLSDNIRWATNISFRDSLNAKDINDIFIELDLYLKPLKLKVGDEKITEIKITDVFTYTESNIVLLGQPGAGKTTSIKKIFLELLLKSNEIYETYNFPIIIRLKDLKKDNDSKGLILLKEILNLLGIFIDFNEVIDKQKQEKIIIHIFKEFIERLNVLIILDGYDEISDEKLKEEIISNLSLLTNSMISSRFILTSRSADYDIHIDNTYEYEICPLKEYQIEQFISKWINNNEKVEEFNSQLRKSPYWDTTMRPLTLAHLCALYERNNSIPDRPKTVYKKIIYLLLEDWSNQRSIKRISQYSKFDVERKTEFLARFAYELTIEYMRISFDDGLLKLLYKSIYKDFELPERDCFDVIREIESHNGLIIQTGTDNYEFAHKSLLEYLVADYLVRSPILISDKEILLSIPNEIAILIAISANPTLTYYDLIINKLAESSVSENFLMKFIYRLYIEKPDFQPQVLLSVTYIYLTNIVARKIKSKQLKLKELKDKHYYSSENSDVEACERSITYLKECMDLILQQKKNGVFKDSLKAIKNYYNIGHTIIEGKSANSVLNKYGKVLLLQRKLDIAESQSIKIEIPKILYLLDDFYSE